MTSIATDPIGHAIVGCGRIGPCHGDAFSRLEGVDIVAACDLEADRAEDFARRWGGRSETSFDTLLDADDVDSISIATPHDLHGPMALAAVAAGKHVLVEKPPVLGPEEGRRLRSAAASAGVVAMPVLQHRFDAVVREVADLVASGDLGQVRFARLHLECARSPEYWSESPWRGSWAREGGSVLMNQAFHLVDVLTFLVGPPIETRSMAARLRPIEAVETEDSVGATLALAGGAMASISMTAAAGSRWRSLVEILGSEGSVEFDIDFPNRLHHFELRSKPAMKRWRARLREATGNPPEITPGLAYYGTSHRDQAAAFVAAIRGDEPVGPAATLDEALQTLEAIRAIYAAAAVGPWAPEGR